MTATGSASARALVALVALAACAKTSTVPPGEAPPETSAAAPSALAPSALAPSAPAASAPAPSRVDALDCPLEIEVAPDKAAALVGEPVYLTLRIRTSCAKTLHVLDGGDYRNRFGRADSFEVRMVDASGAESTPLAAGPGFGGMIGPRQVAAGKPFEKRFLLPHWFDAPPAGRYTITIAKKLLIGEASTPNSEDKTAVPVSASAIVAFRDGTSAELGKVIDDLGARVLGVGDDAEEAVNALSTMRDPRVVPFFVKLASGDRASIRIKGVWGLRPHGTDEAVSALEKALDDPALAIAAAQTLAENPHPRAWDVLWAHRAHKDDNVRLTVLHTLARKKDLVDQRQRISGFTSDAAPIVRGEAARYLRELGGPKTR
ncbi:MAG: HEAT repeat domain-containing protein [Deltaproteobacteria bacterium]|nr:HEAT repeat domain-containing protein [Deltaproteobacteria bacterium]